MYGKYHFMGPLNISSKTVTQMIVIYNVDCKIVLSLVLHMCLDLSGPQWIYV